MDRFDIQALTMGDVVVSGKGAKTVSILAGGNPIVWQPEAQAVCYEPTSFNGEDVSRVNLVLRASPAAVDALATLDAAIIRLVTTHSVRLFGKQLTDTEVHTKYNRSLKESEKGYSTT